MSYLKPFVALSLLFSCNAWAVGEAELFSATPNFPGARAAGLGGAFEAVASDWTASYWNPAGLSRLKRVEISAGINHTNWTNDATVINLGPKTESRNRLNRLDHIGLAMPVPSYRGSMVWAVGWSRLQDFNLPFKTREDLYTFEVNEDGEAGIFSFSLAGQLSKTFHGGVSLQLYSGKDEYLTSSSDGESTENSFRESSFNGAALRFGALVQPFRQLRFSSTLTTPVALKQSIEGFEYTFRLPMEIGFGLSWEERSWLVSASVTHQDWSTAEYDDFPSNGAFSNGQAQLLNRELATGYAAQNRYSFGAEWTVPELPLRLRGGVWTRNLAQTSASFEEEGLLFGNYAEDEPFRGLSLGLGWLFDELLALDFVWTREQGSYSYLDSSVRIQEDQTRQNFKLTLNYRM